MLGRGVFGLCLILSGCVHRPKPPPAPPRPPQFEVGQAYRSQGEWRYPQAFNNYDMTGLATVLAAPDGAVLADNEAYHPDALIAASPVLQLPSVATVTNLANGYTMDVRVAGRGPDDPGRILAVSPRVAQLLRFPADGVAEVEVVLKPQATSALDGALGQGPQLTAAPLAGITAQPLGAPGAGADGGAAEQLTPADQAGPVADAGAVSGRLTAEPASPGPLYVQIPGFGRERDARAAQAALYGIPSVIVPVMGDDRVLYAVNAGPCQTAKDADAALRQMLAQGVSDPQIIVR